MLMCCFVTHKYPYFVELFLAKIGVIRNQSTAGSHSAGPLTVLPFMLLETSVKGTDPPPEMQSTKLLTSRILEIRQRKQPNLFLRFHML